MSEERRLPPVTELGVVSMALVVASGVYMAAHLPHRVPLGPSAALLGASALLMAVNLAGLARAEHFAWGVFFGVARHAFTAYLIIAGLLAYVFIKDGTRGGQLVVLLGSLLVFAIHVPLLIGFTVARFAQDPRDPA